MTQNIVIQVGQCGNQIGHEFWDIALKEHISNRKKNKDNSSFNAFFDCSSSSKDSVKGLKARAILIDMEEGVLGGVIKSKLGHLFDHHQLITDVSGSANNWAVGFHEYGGMHHDTITDVINKAVQKCDCLQSFFIIHSMGGGTGSGLGTYVLKLLEENYPEVYRFVIPIFPSEDDDVITSPYNCLLALNKLMLHADCVLPVENQALSNIVKKIDDKKLPDKYGRRMFSSLSSTSFLPPPSSSSSLPKSYNNGGNSDAFVSMNNIVANLMLNLTCSSRYNGSLNVDLNELTTNLVPYPDLKFIIASQSPICSINNPITSHPSRLNNLFSEAFSRDHQMIKSELKSGVFLSCGLLLRGDVLISDVKRNIERLKPTLKFAHWNQEGWKIGICSQAVDSVNHSAHLLLLSNNTSIRHNFQCIHDRFIKLYSRKAHLHHYTRVAGMDGDEFETSLHSIHHLIQSYQKIEYNTLYGRLKEIPRLKILS